jgi:Zn-finger protein
MVMLADEIPEGGNIKSCSDCGYVITKADIIDILNERQEYLNKNKEKHKSAEKKKGL